MRQTLTVVALLMWLGGCDEAPSPRYPYYPDSGMYYLDSGTYYLDSGAYFLDGAAPPAADSGAAPDACPITDVLPGDPLRTAACWAVQKGIMDAPGGLFQPTGTLTRAVMAKQIVLLAFGSTFALASQSRFSDVPQSDPYYKYVQKLGEEKISAGCTVAGDKFCPGDLATNAHGASFVVNLKYKAQTVTLASQTPYFTDVAASHWGFTTIQKLHEDKSDAPCGAQTYCPDSSITRGKWATVLHASFPNK